MQKVLLSHEKAEFMALEKIMGFDPGTNLMGYGCIQGSANKWVYITAGTIRLNNRQHPFEKLHSIFVECRKLMEVHKPSHVAIEAPFYGKNIQSMLKLGRAQGVCIAAVSSLGITPEEYAPRRIKQSITGNGNASKEQVAAMLKHILGSDDISTELDASDALAAALCHAFQLNNPLTGKGGKTNWEQFIQQNPDKLL